MQIVLATTSKWKSEILNKTHIKHKMIESDFLEKSVKCNNVYDMVKEISYGKAFSVKDKVKDAIIIGLDTVVYVDGKILEKPKSLVEARHFIEISKNNTTKVITGVCIINTITNECIKDYQETKVTLADITDKDIDYYIKNEKDIMYVSGFIIENIMSNFIEKIEGSFYNIIGIPVELIYKYINSMGYYLEDLK